MPAGSVRTPGFDVWVGPVGLMIGGSVMSWTVAVMVTGPAFAIDMLFGMFGPLLVAVSSWQLVERTYRSSPERLTGLMVTAFAGKMIFFGSYVALALLGLSLRPVPFVVSFTAFFVGLLVTEALCLRRLFVDAASR